MVWSGGLIQNRVEREIKHHEDRKFRNKSSMVDVKV